MATLAVPSRIGWPASCRGTTSVTMAANFASAEYALEYGTAKIEMHRDAFAPGRRVVLIDDLLATGGTAAAAAELVGQLRGEVAGIAFLIELLFLNGRSKLAAWDVASFVRY